MDVHLNRTRRFGIGCRRSGSARRSVMRIMLSMSAGAMCLMGTGPAPVQAQELRAPKPVGPYSPAVVAGDFVFLAGQLALDPVTGAIEPGSTIEAQTRQVWANIRAVLKSQNLELSDVVNVTVFMTDIGEFSRMNAAYAEALGATRPARTTVGVKELLLGAKIEIGVIAYRGSAESKRR